MMVLTVFIVSACVPKAGQPVDETTNTGDMANTGDMVDTSMSGTMLSGTTESTDSIVMWEPTVINAETSLVERKWEKIWWSHNGTINLKEWVIMMNEWMMVWWSLTINMATIAVTDIPADDASNASLVSHLTWTDFFATDEYPEAMFVATDIDSTWFPTIIANGDMTIKGVTKPMTITLYANEWFTQLTGTIDIDRTEFGVMYSSTKLLDTIKDKAIDDIFTLDFTLVLDDTMTIIDNSSMDSTVTPLETTSWAMDETDTPAMSDDEAINEVEKMLNEIE